MPKELPSDFDLQIIANSIEAACVDCSKSGTQERAQFYQGEVFAGFGDLQDTYRGTGVDINPFISELKQRCSACFKGGHERPLIQLQYGCGIRVRVQEKI